jgi:hypothetical protein
MIFGEISFFSAFFLSYEAHLGWAKRGVPP